MYIIVSYVSWFHDSSDSHVFSILVTLLQHFGHLFHWLFWLFWTLTFAFNIFNQNCPLSWSQIGMAIFKHVEYIQNSVETFEIFQFYIIYICSFVFSVIVRDEISDWRWLRCHGCPNFANLCNLLFFLLFVSHTSHHCIVVVWLMWFDSIDLFWFGC